jgi:hypothetical protein
MLLERLDKPAQVNQHGYFASHWERLYSHRSIALQGHPTTLSEQQTSQELFYHGTLYPSSDSSCADDDSDDDHYGDSPLSALVRDVDMVVPECDDTASMDAVPEGDNAADTMIDSAPSENTWNSVRLCPPKLKQRKSVDKKVVQLGRFFL